MKTDKKEIGKNQVELTIRVTKTEAQPYLVKAAAHLSEHRPIKGFRPGKAPYDMVKREFGEGAIIQEALEDIINGTFGQVLEQENLNAYGKIGFNLLPALNADEIAAYQAVVTLMPTVTLGNWQNKKIKRQDVAVTNEELSKAIDELGAMMTTEEPKAGVAAMGDKTVVDFEVLVDNQVIEGGAAKDFGLILGEGRMIPGFEEKIVGTKPGQELNFTLNFPDNYQAKHLSGKPATFKIRVNQVLARVKPAINDAFAKKMGAPDLAELKAKLADNLKKEKTDREEERVEIAAIKQLVDSGKFTELPAEMIGETAHDLVHEFEHTLAHQGMQFDQYLQSINKTEADLIRDFEPRATERIKSSMALGQLAEDEKLTIMPEEIEEEIKAQKKSYAGNQEALNDMKQPEYRRHVANSLINRKIINFIKEKIVE